MTWTGDVMSKSNLDPAQVAQVIQAVLSALNETPSSVVDTAVPDKPEQLPTTVAKAPKTRNRQKRNQNYPNAAKPWTALQTAAMVTLLNKGGIFNRETVGELLGRTKSAVQAEVTRVRSESRTSTLIPSAVPNHFWTKEQDAELLRLRDSGLQWTQIGIYFKRSDDACRGRYRRLKEKEEASRILPQWRGSNVFNIPVDDVFGGQQPEAG